MVSIGRVDKIFIVGVVALVLIVVEASAHMGWVASSTEVQALSLKVSNLDSKLDAIMELLECLIHGVEDDGDSTGLLRQLPPKPEPRKINNRKYPVFSPDTPDSIVIASGRRG